LARRTTVPWAIANAASKRRARNPAVTEIVKIPNRGHSLTIDRGWREVAQTAREFVKRFVPGNPARRPSCQRNFSAGLPTAIDAHRPQQRCCSSGASGRDLIAQLLLYSSGGHLPRRADSLELRGKGASRGRSLLHFRGRGWRDRIGDEPQSRDATMLGAREQAEARRRHVRGLPLVAQSGLATRLLVRALAASKRQPGPTAIASARITPAGS
jgi:hypothetical protein